VGVCKVINPPGLRVLKSLTNFETTLAAKPVDSAGYFLYTYVEQTIDKLQKVVNYEK
jgi:hypothetical protein